MTLHCYNRIDRRELEDAIFNLEDAAIRSRFFGARGVSSRYRAELGDRTYRAPFKGSLAGALAAFIAESEVTMLSRSQERFNELLAKGSLLKPSLFTSSFSLFQRLLTTPFTGKHNLTHELYYLECLLELFQLDNLDSNYKPRQDVVDSYFEKSGVSDRTRDRDRQAINDLLLDLLNVQI